MKARIKETLITVDVVGFTDVSHEFAICKFPNGEHVIYPTIALDFVSIKDKIAFAKKVLKERVNLFFGDNKTEWSFIIASIIVLYFAAILYVSLKK